LLIIIVHICPPGALRIGRNYDLLITC